MTDQNPDNFKILLVEDDGYMSRMYQRAFRLEGFDVSVAPDGKAAYAQALHSPPDLILMDVMMPKMNGLDTLEKLKKDPTTKDIRVIMLTNLSSQLDSDTALGYGAYRYVIKSDHDVKEVVTIVRDALRDNPEK